MNLWHATPDAPRVPARPSPGGKVSLRVGTWPAQPGQKVRVGWRAARPDGRVREGEVEASWEMNEWGNSYWTAGLGPFEDGEEVRYTVRGRSPDGSAPEASSSFTVEPKIHLALLWHHHQPLYAVGGNGREFYRFPWVRLHALRDYYAMAALAAQYPGVHLTINLTPSLLQQIESYAERRAMDRALELTLKPAARLTAGERREVLSTFFDADWHNQIYVHPRYKELFERRVAGGGFSVQDLADLQMWFSLAWFAPEFLEAPYRLHDGTKLDLRRLVVKGRDFSRADVKEMAEAQYAVMRNVVPLHRALQEAGQIEVSTTPFYHPILPLIHDTDLATVDRPGASRPGRFHFPEDARAQVERAAAFHESRFGRRPRGMWPAEGAVGQSVLEHFAGAGVRWVTTDEGVLERSGKWGYQADQPDVLCRPYRAEGEGWAVSVFFRDRALSDAVSFKYQGYADQAEAARDFIRDMKSRLAQRVSDPANRVVTVVLDGENAWGAYRQAARPFFHALYAALNEDPEIKTVTFSEYIEGNPGRALLPHPVRDQAEVHDLFHGSWIDERDSAPGVDLGTWIGEEEENRAWALLAAAREALRKKRATPSTHPRAFEAVYAAEGSDWFWWFGDDQDSGYDEAFDDLFRGHLRSAYRGAGRKAPAALDRHIVPHAVVWTFTAPVAAIQRRDRLTVRTNCEGTLHWSMDGWGSVREAPLKKAGGVMAGLHSYSLTLEGFEGAEAVEFVFKCGECGCGGEGPCCGGERRKVEILKSVEEA